MLESIKETSGQFSGELLIGSAVAGQLGLQGEQGSMASPRSATRTNEIGLAVTLPPKSRMKRSPRHLP